MVIDTFIILGPFGTGKTKTLAEYILQEVLRGKRVLATAESNLAVDNLVERLYGKAKIVRVGHPSRIDSRLIKVSMEHLKKEHEKHGELEEIWKEIEECTEKRDREVKPVPRFRRGLTESEILDLARRRVKAYRGISWAVLRSMARWIELTEKIEELFREAEELEKRIEKDIIENSEIVLTTNSTAFTLNSDFDVAVVDEASQSTIPSTLIPLCRAEKFVLAGDHRQLPPTVMNVMARELERTLFEILIEKYPFKSEMLRIQYRMRKELADFSSLMFYSGLVETHESVEKISIMDFRPELRDEFSILLSKYPLVFIDTEGLGRERKKKGSKSVYNPLEAELVFFVLEKLKKMGIEMDRVGVITPYDDQVRLIRDFADCEGKSVDGYQGKEKDVIIISFVRSNSNGEIGFLRDYRRLNVSLTRAKRLIVAIGDSKTLSTDPVYRRFLNYVQKKGKVIKAGELKTD